MQERNLAGGAIQPHALAGFEALGGAVDADRGREAVFAGNHRTVGHQAADFGADHLPIYPRRCQP